MVSPWLVERLGCSWLSVLPLFGIQKPFCRSMVCYLWSSNGTCPFLMLIVVSTDYRLFQNLGCWVWFWFLFVAQSWLFLCWSSLLYCSRRILQSLMSWSTAARLWWSVKSPLDMISIWYARASLSIVSCWICQWVLSWLNDGMMGRVGW